MSEKRVTVWVQQFKDRPALMLQWLDPDTGKRKSKSAETADPDKAETARADLEYELNHGKYQEASRMTWERFRELFEHEYVSGTRENTRDNYAATLDLFEELCNPTRLRSINERTLSAFAAAMRKRPVRGRDGMMPSSIKVRLQFLHTALKWAEDQGLIPKCPKAPTVKVPQKLPQPVPVEAFERLLAKAPDLNMRTYLLTAWLGGLRLEEAFVLEWEETDQAPYLDLAGSRIVMPAEFTKAGRDQWVPLDQQLRDALAELPRHGKRVFRFVSTGNNKGDLISAPAVGCRVIRLAKKAGVKMSYHTLRKGFGCRYAGKVPAQVLQRLMRHANIKTTMDYYVNVDDAAMEAVLGPNFPLRNTSRNRQPEGLPVPENTSDVTPFSEKPSASS
jgi:integrase